MAIIAYALNVKIFCSLLFIWLSQGQLLATDKEVTSPPNFNHCTQLLIRADDQMRTSQPD